MSYLDYSSPIRTKGPPAASNVLIPAAFDFDADASFESTFDLTCAGNDNSVLVGLRHGTCHASLGVDNDLHYLKRRLRGVWPDVQVHVRGDSGLGVPGMYEACREQRLSHTSSIAMESQECRDDDVGGGGMMRPFLPRPRTEDRSVNRTT